MDKNFRLSRHSQLWEEKNKAVKRTAIAGLFFAAFILINVLQPYSKQQDASAPIRDEIRKLEEDRVETVAALASLEDLQKELELVEQALQDKPGENQKDQLIDAFRQLNAEATFDRKRFQAEADKTILTIEKEVRDLLAPCAKLLADKPELGERLPDVAAALEDLSESLTEWSQSNLGKVWYSTIRQKESTILELNQELEREYSDVPKLLDQAWLRLTGAITDNTRSLQDELASLKEQEAKKQSTLDDLNRKMQQIMPEWLRGLISIDQMVQFYPLIMMGLVLYIVGNGLSLTRHYLVIAQERDWSFEEASDPAYSSLWTLSYRGLTATLFSVLTYLGLIIAFWFFYEQGSDLYLGWRTAGNEAMVAVDQLATPTWVWVERLLFIIIGILVLLWPWRKLAHFQP